MKKFVKIKENYKNSSILDINERNNHHGQQIKKKT